MNIYRYTGLVSQKLDVIDYIILSIFIIIFVIADLNLIIPKFSIEYEINAWISICSYFIVWYIGIRFRNIYFSLIWLVLVLQYFFLIESDLSVYPIVGFCYYHVLRLVYWIKYNEEFIPVAFSRYRGFIMRHSKLIKRETNDKDQVFSFLLYVGSFVLIGLLIDFRD